MWGTHVWVRARSLSIEIADDPVEAWFEAMHPVWARHLAARGFREAFLARRGERPAAARGDADQEDAR